MGHKVGLGLDKSYFRPQDMLAEYQKAINNLTINEENRLRVKVKKLEIENSEYESLRDEFEKFKADILSRRKGK